MAGRTLRSEKESIARGFDGPDCARRRAVLHETIRAFERTGDAYHAQATRNLARWRDKFAEPASGFNLHVLPCDWGEVALSMTMQYGECFAVLNMANADVPGGAYVEGAAAQEENMFRRTDCHFQISNDHFDPETDTYTPEMTRLLEASGGRVLLDSEQPRVCIRGPEDMSRSDPGYHWLADDEVFPFFELRASAQDLRDGKVFSGTEARRRIAAQFDTLEDRRLRHVVFGAFGCGAFLNPADRVARIYREEIEKRSRNFRVIAFAVFDAGYGPKNFGPFSKAFHGFSAERKRGAKRAG